MRPRAMYKASSTGNHTTRPQPAGASILGENEAEEIFLACYSKHIDYRIVRAL